MARGDERRGTAFSAALAGRASPRSIVDAPQFAIDLLTDEDAATSQVLQGSGCSSNLFTTSGSLWWSEHAGRFRRREDQKLTRMLLQGVRNGLLIPGDELVLIRCLRKRSNHDRTRA